MAMNIDKERLEEQLQYPACALLSLAEPGIWGHLSYRPCCSRAMKCRFSIVARRATICRRKWKGYVVIEQTQSNSGRRLRAGNSIWLLIQRFIPAKRRRPWWKSSLIVLADTFF